MCSAGFSGSVEGVRGSLGLLARLEGRDPPPRSGEEEVSLDELTLEELRQVEREEAAAVRLKQIRKEEEAVTEESQALAAEKALLLRDLKRVRDEEASRFADRPVLAGRYFLLHLLGKGGFSEVWKAMDLYEVVEVGVKVHQLAPSWSDTKKQNYIRHATREYAIHKELRHRNVVRLLDVFEIDLNSFATVIEYCRGPDLDHVLKQSGALPEREARAILLQISAALGYLNGVRMPSEVAEVPAPPERKEKKKKRDGGVSPTVGVLGDTASGLAPASASASGAAGALSPGAGSGSGSAAAPAPPPGEAADESEGLAPHRRIIHYDLKPANILFDEHRNVKITDFGLSKILDESAPGAGLGMMSSMELTSQGAGTYWYLPPECFEMGPSPPRISSKVDVWSVGVIFFQMLFGKRPFGDGQSQERLLADKVILRATAVSFPAKPVVSALARDFISCCLTADQRQRPDVRGMLAHPYLRAKMK